MGNLGRPARGIAAILALVVGSAALATLIAPWFWVGELVTHWSTHLALVGVIPWVLWRRVRWASWCMTACIAVLVWPGIRAAWEARLPPLGADDIGIRVASANIHYGQPLRAGDIRVITDCGADVLVLIEIDTGDEDSFRDDPRWPHQTWRHRGDATRRGLGIAVLSRWPFQADPADDQLEDVLITGVVTTPRGPLHLIAAHPQSPGRAAKSVLRDRQLAHMARLVRNRHGPLVLLGDLNCTPRSPAWSAFIEAGLRRPAAPSPATWPAVFGPCGIAIDHVLGQELRASATRARSIPGSDHRMVVTTLAWDSRPAP